MKLRNKKTGEIGFVYTGLNCEVMVCSEHDENHTCLGQYSSLSELNEEWEDVLEEPKTEFYITAWGDVREYTTEEERFAFKQKLEIGNHFETEEEAEQAVEKLKAWKRLKDKGFRFTLTPGVGSLDITPGKFQIEITAEMPEKWFCCDAVQEDLDDCFGGEE